MNDIKNSKALLIDRLRNPKTGMLNLREFRDQLLGRRAVKPILVAWGLYNGCRLGIKAEIEGKVTFLIILETNGKKIEETNRGVLEEEDKDDIDFDNMIIMGPQVVRFTKECYPKEYVLILLMVNVKIYIGILRITIEAEIQTNLILCTGRIIPL